MNYTKIDITRKSTQEGICDSCITDCAFKPTLAAC